MSSDDVATWSPSSVKAAVIVLAADGEKAARHTLAALAFSLAWQGVDPGYPLGARHFLANEKARVQQ